jgi:glycosyltransferase involved in cell wall biosynthesis
MKCPISVLIVTRNEEHNLRRCLDAWGGWADEIAVVDSQSTDSTLDIADAHGATVVQFHYTGGWPKKRQWALDNLGWKNDWILLLDADEMVSPEIKVEIATTIRDSRYNGYWIPFQIFFLGRELRHGGTVLRKLCLFRKGKGHFEIRIKDQDHSMSDIEVHEHMVVEGKTGLLNSRIRHENLNSLDRYITKHNEYSNWEAKMLFEGGRGEIEPSLFGNQAQRRRFLTKKFLGMPGSPLAYFLLRYIVQLGFLDGKPGFIYCMFSSIQMFHVKSKLYEMRSADKQLGL